MLANCLYSILLRQMIQLRPEERIPRLRNMSWLMVGIYLRRSVHISKIALKIPGRAKVPSITRRLTRFLENPAIRVREWFEPIARAILQAAAATMGEIRLIADGTKVSLGHQLLVVSLTFRRRAIPIAWTWVKTPRGHSSAIKQLALLAYVQRWIPQGILVLLVGDSEFGAVEVIQQLEAWGWQYVLRQKASHRIRLPGGDWQRFGEVIGEPGQSRWLGQGQLTYEHGHPTNLLAHWERGEDEPWLLATHLSSCRQKTLKAYRRRMWVEEMFGDLKGNVFDLESSHLVHFLSIIPPDAGGGSAVCLFVAEGSWVIKNGQRHQVDRANRRDLSIFQIGLRWVERCLTNAWPVSTKFIPSFG